MAPYEYAKLDTEANEFRLLTLLPGEFVDALEVSISHVSLPVPEECNDTRMPIKELQKTLPSGWAVHETLDGRYIFAKECTTGTIWHTTYTTWIHPDPHFLLDAYDGYALDRRPNYEPKFEALSYAWGSIDNTETLFVRNTPSTSGSAGEIQVTENLAIALRHLRYATRSRVLWIDAVCINQRDLAERNGQVPRMGSIYRLSRKNVFWIGPATTSSSLALSTLAFFGCQVEYTKGNDHLPSPDAEKPDWWMNSTPLPYNDKILQALDSLFKCPWFERLWIVQEVLLSCPGSVMQCGNDAISWNLVRRSILRLTRKDLPLSSLREALRRCRDSLCWPRYTPLELLASNTSQKCTDSRDRIYAILSLVPEQFAKLISIDYSLAPTDIFKEVFLALMRYSNRIDALQYGRIDNQILGVPTWAPTWCKSRGVSGILPACWAASCASAAYAVFSAPNQLKVQGLKVATIRSIREPNPGNLQQLPIVIRESWSEISHMTEYVHGESLLDALVSTYTMYRDVETHPGFDFCTQMRWKELFTKVVSKTDDALASSELVREFQRAFGGDALNLSFFTTMEDFIGLASGEAQIGDHICIFLGCSMPIILRQSLRQPGQFYVIGACFVHGIMFGEGFLGPFQYPFHIQLSNDSGGHLVPSYLDTVTRERSHQDPRLSSINDVWEEVPTSENPPYAIGSVHFRNGVTGKTINSDPHFLPEVLSERGTELQTFTLI